jgi:pyruvate dehydrogenase E1 component alpha subunit
MKHATKESLIAFENRIRDIFAAGDLPFLIHLAGGNEQQLVEIFEQINEGDWILGSHRSHYHYLLAGGSEAELEHGIREGRSMFLFNKQLNFLTSSVLAGTCGIAAGIALALKSEGSKSKVWCFLGDGAADQGHFFEAAMYVEGWDLPCTFVIEDNDRSVDTNRRDRRGPVVEDKGLPWAGFDHVRRYCYNPTYPHGGAGLKTMITFKKEIVEKHARKDRPA